MLITISRQYAAGGEQVARRVADALGWHVVDNEFVQWIADRTGLQPEEVARKEERTPGFLERFTRFSALADPELLSPEAGQAELDEERLLKITRELVEELAHAGRMVVVGRAAAAVLGAGHDAVHARLVAPIDFRVRQAMETLDLDEATARRELEERDRNRERYHREYYKRDWNDPLLYHMVLNTALLGFDGAADAIVSRARGLGW